MKNIQKLFLYFALSLSGIFFLSACTGEDQITNWVEPETDFFPILMDRETMEQSIGFETQQQIETPGKLYVYGTYILLNERYQGIHLIDNTDRRNPRQIGFFRIPGNLDMAVKDGKMYADNGTDLLVVDLLNPQAPELIHRGRGVFPELPPPDLRAVPTAFQAGNRPENTVIVGWREQ